jgi:hypothetical protein
VVVPPLPPSGIPQRSFGDQKITEKANRCTATLTRWDRRTGARRAERRLLLALAPMGLLDCICGSKQPAILPVATDATDAPVAAAAASSSSSTGDQVAPAPAGLSAIASALRSGEGSSSGGKAGQVSIATADGAEVADKHAYFSVKVRAGNGTMFSLNVHEKLKVDDVHKQIARKLGEAECPLYALRLIYKSKVLSHRPDELLGDFGIAEGEMLQLVVVRAHTLGISARATQAARGGVFSLPNHPASD